MTPPTRTSRGAFRATLRVFDLSIGEMLWSRRTIFMALVVGLPVVLSVVLRVLVETGVPLVRIDRVEITGATIFGLMVWAFFVRFSIPVLAVFYGTGLIADEVEERTITYLFTRPIPREAVLFGKYLAYLVCTVFVVLPAVVVIWWLLVPVGGSLAEGFPDLLKDLGLLMCGLAVYGAVFALVGAAFRRPLIFGLLFVFGWELLALALPGDLKWFTVAYYLQALVPHAMPPGSALGILETLFRDTPSLGQSLGAMLIIEVGGLWLASRIVATREYVLDQ